MLLPSMSNSQLEIDINTKYIILTSVELEAITLPHCQNTMTQLFNVESRLYLA